MNITKPEQMTSGTSKVEEAVSKFEEQLEKDEAEVKRLKEAIEDSKIKVGDWGKFWDGDKDEFIISKIKKFNYGYVTLTSEHFLNCEKITNKELINKLNEL